MVSQEKQPIAGTSLITTGGIWNCEKSSAQRWTRAGAVLRRHLWDLYAAREPEAP